MRKSYTEIRVVLIAVLFGGYYLGVQFIGSNRWAAVATLPAVFLPIYYFDRKQTPDYDEYREQTPWIWRTLPLVIGTVSGVLLGGTIGVLVLEWGSGTSLDIMSAIVAPSISGGVGFLVGWYATGKLSRRLPPEYFSTNETA